MVSDVSVPLHKALLSRKFTHQPISHTLCTTRGKPQFALSAQFLLADNPRFCRASERQGQVGSSTSPACPREPFSISPRRQCPWTQEAAGAPGWHRRANGLAGGVSGAAPAAMSGSGGWGWWAGPGGAEQLADESGGTVTELWPGLPWSHCWQRKGVCVCVDTHRQT